MIISENNMARQKKTILLDLDGVLNTYNKTYDHDYIPPIRNGAKDFVKKLSEKYTVKLFTTRRKSLALGWIKENDLNEFISDITNIKEPAWLMIDDRCIKFNGEYDELIQQVDNFNVWYKK